MNKQPFDDQELQIFIRKHRPIPPPAAPEVEAQLMQAIAFNSNYKQTHLAIAKPQKQIRQQWWLISSTIAAGLVIAWSSSRLLIPSPELANSNLQYFLETNWNDVTNIPNDNNRQTDWMLQTN